MRRTVLRTALFTALGAALSIGLPSGNAAPRATQFLDPGPGGFTSSNVTYVASIPTGAGVSAREVTVKGQRRLYVSSAHSLTIYDITNPALPVPLGALPIYNWENEDIAVSKDGATTILTEFESSFYLHVIDTSDPTTPMLAGTLEFDGSHTVECADVHCNYLFASNGKTYDISDKGGPLALSRTPVALPKDKWWSTELGVSGGHALHQDAAGVWIADETPWVMFTAKDPEHVKLLTKGQPTLNPVYQHNNVRPAADKWTPRKKHDKSTTLRPGEMLMTETESNFNPQCSGANGTGSFSTWSIANFDKGATPKQMHVLTPVQGDYADGNPAFNALGCSGHWFNVREDQPGRYKGDYVVAAGWYEHGTRFLSVDEKTGVIKQIGYFQPVRGSTSAAYWIDKTNYVYVVDYQRGIDILKFDPSAAPPTAAQTRASWLAKLNTIDTISQQERYWCRQAMEHPTGI
jgi:LVIVD repeat-containing protein